MADGIVSEPDPRVRQTSVYKYYDSRRLLLYVGITAQGTARQRQHNADKDWWKFVREQDVEHFESRELARVREKQLIERFAPPFNVQHNPKHEQLKALYYQYGRKEAPAPIKIGRLVSRGNKRSLALYPTPESQGYEQLVTDIEDKPITDFRRFCPVHVYDLRGRNVGSLTNMHRRGDCVRLSLHLKPGLDIVSAALHVRFKSLKQPAVVEMKRVVVSTRYVG